MITTDLVPPVFVISADNPPANALSPAVRRGLWQALGEAEADPSVGAIVLRARRQSYLSGSDLPELERGSSGPSLAELAARIEASEKPVVAAINGSVRGGGLEVMMACHYRIALSEADFGLPEASQGALPSAGTIERLAKLIGLEAALPMLALSQTADAPRALELGLIDCIADPQDLDQLAFEMAKSLISKPIRRSSALPLRAHPKALARFAASHAIELAALEGSPSRLAALASALPA